MPIRIPSARYGSIFYRMQLSTAGIESNRALRSGLRFRKGIMSSLSGTMGRDLTKSTAINFLKYFSACMTRRSLRARGWDWRSRRKLYQSMVEKCGLRASRTKAPAFIFHYRFKANIMNPNSVEVLLVEDNPADA